MGLKSQRLSIKIGVISVPVFQIQKQRIRPAIGQMLHKLAAKNSGIKTCYINVFGMLLRDLDASNASLHLEPHSPNHVPRTSNPAPRTPNLKIKYQQPKEYK